VRAVVSRLKSVIFAVSVGRQRGPVSSTSIPCKTMETIIKNEMVTKLQVSKIISKNQHGFVEGKSCLTNLLEMLDDWTKALDKGYGIDGIEDWAKAAKSWKSKSLMGFKTEKCKIKYVGHKLETR